MSKHTLELWEATDRHILNRQGEIIVTNGDYLLHEPTVINRCEAESCANLHRIVACVNACAGVDAPATLRTQRDALLTACEALLAELCMPVLPGNGGYTPGALAAVGAANVAIAEVRRGL